ncbi:MAG: DUF262 domain-containing protein [Chloroflexi bacterium]|nr:DUF262 domain-containing protein [Chloroflexota bacterium]
MSNEIESNKIFIRDVFKWWFRVPDYQRPYVWGTDQVNDLLDDVSEWGLSRPDSEYFLGSIVLQRRSNNGIVEYDLLDGQQRLSTCLLIHAVGRDLTNDDRLKRSCQKTIFQEEDPFDNIPERLRIIYDVRDDVRRFVNEIIKPHGGTNNEEKLKTALESQDLSVRNLARAVGEIRRYFSDEDSISLESFFTFFRNKVLMVYVASPDLDDAFRMFTVLNDRGMKLRGSDILKTLNLRALREEKVSDEGMREWAQFWEGIEGELGDDFDVFLSHLRAVLVKDKARLSLLQEFEDNIYAPKVSTGSKSLADRKPILKMGSDTFNFVQRYYEHYQQLFSGNNYHLYDSWEFDNLIILLNDTSLANFWIPPLLHYRATFLAITASYHFYTNWKTSSAAIGLHFQTPTDRIQSMNQITAKIDEVNSDHSLDKATKVEQLLQSNAFSYDEERFIEILRHYEIYHRRFARYLLFPNLDVLYGSKDTKLQTPRWISVEHILPQNPHGKAVAYRFYG